MIDAAVEQFGRLDVLVANAGIIPLGSITESTVEDWDAVMAIDGRGMFLTCKYAIEAMLQTGGGSIVCLSSISGMAGQSRQSTYGPAKFVATGSRSISRSSGPIAASASTPSRRARSGPSASAACRTSRAAPSTSRRSRSCTRWAGSASRSRSPARSLFLAVRRGLVHHRRDPAGRRRLPRPLSAASCGRRAAAGRLPRDQ